MSWCLSSFAECVMCDPARYCSDCCLSDCNPTLLGRIEKCELAVSVSECCRLLVSSKLKSGQCTYCVLEWSSYLVLR